MPALSAYMPDYPRSSLSSPSRPASPTPTYDRLKANSWMATPEATDPTFRANNICASAASAAKQQSPLVLPTAEEAVAEAARGHAPHGPCCAGCAEGHPCEGAAAAPAAPLPYSSAADLCAPCGGLPYEDEAAAVYASCAAASPRQRPLVLPSPEEAAADVAAEGSHWSGCGTGTALKGLSSPRYTPLATAAAAPKPPVAPCHPCSPNYSPRSGYFSPKPTPRCDPDSLSAPRPVSPCCSPKFVDAHVRDFPYSTRLLPSYSSPLSSPRRMEAPPSPPAVGGRRYPSPGRGRSASPSGYAARPYFGEAVPFPYPLPPYSKFPLRPLSPARLPLASAYAPRLYTDLYPTASNLLPTPYGGWGFTDGRHLRALSPNRFYDYENIPITSPRLSYLEHLARIEAETQRLRMELRGY